MRILSILLVALLMTACSKSKPDEVVVLKTELGTIYIDVYEHETPLHASNFKRLASSGQLVGTYFHRVVPGFVIQGGDPNTKNDDRGDDGYGGIGERIPAEIGMKHLRGSVGMARDNNPTKASNGSQFYICLKNLPQLDGGYTVFGKVIKGMEVVDKIAALERDERDNPLESVHITATEVVPRNKLGF